MSIRKLENLMISLYYYLMADGKKKGEEVQWQIQGVVYKGCNLSLKLEKIKKEKKIGTEKKEEEVKNVN